MASVKQCDVTYCRGLQCKFTKNITKKEYIEICEELNVGFAEKFGGSYSFQPESITEGGLVMVQFPSKDGRMYKTMRHRLVYNNRLGMRTCISWPWIGGDETIEAWKLDESVLIPSGTESDTFLKAFHGAPCWSIAELILVREVFLKHGIKSAKMPKQGDLLSSSGKYTQ